MLRDLELKPELYEREIEFTAQVQEQHSGRTRNSSATLRVYERELKIDLLRDSNTFKPGFPFRFRIRVAHPDDTPFRPEEFLLANKTHSVSSGNGVNLDPEKLTLHFGYSYNEDNYTQTMELPIRQGIAEGVLYPPRDEQLLILGMRVDHFGVNYHLESTEAAQTLSGHHIQIRSDALSRGVQVGQKIKVHVNGTEQLPVLVYQVIARGELVFAGSVNGGARETTFDILINHKMSPKARIFVHYARATDHELLVDAISFNVDGLFRTPVQINTSVEQ